MLTGFEDFTGPLTEEEHAMASFLITYFSNSLPPDTPIKNAEIATLLGKAGYKKPDGPRVRKIISYIRINNLVEDLLASSKGYYTSKNPDEIARYIGSLEERAKVIWGIARNLKKTETKYRNPTLF